MISKYCNYCLDCLGKAFTCEDATQESSKSMRVCMPSHFGKQRDLRHALPLRTADGWYQDTNVRNALSGVVRPVKEEGIDSFEIRQNDQLVASVTNEEVDYFDPPELQELMLDQANTHVFSIVSLAFREGNKWRLTDGQLTFSVSMKDSEFQSRVDNNDVAFAKGDLLVCDMRTIQWLTHQGIKTEYEIIKVNKHMLARQPRLLGLEFTEQDNGE